MTNPNVAQNFPKGVNNWVEAAMYDSRVGPNGLARFELGTPAAAVTTGIFNAVSINTAITNYATFDPAYTSAMQGDAGIGNAPFGRNLTVVLSGAGTPTITVRGRDYLGQPMAETFTGNGTTPVVGKKAFKWVDSVTSTLVAATTLSVGWGNVLGLPLKANQLISESIDGVATANAGTFTAAISSATPQTATTGDPRGTIAPHSSNLPNGTRTFAVATLCDKNNLHGNKHYYA